MGVMCLSMCAMCDALVCLCVCVCVWVYCLVLCMHFVCVCCIHCVCVLLKVGAGQLVGELLVGGLVFISGFTHFTHCWKHADFSWRRLGTVSG